MIIKGTSNIPTNQGSSGQGGSGSSGVTLYEHIIYVSSSADSKRYIIKVINDNNTSIDTLTKLINYFYNKLGTDKVYPMSGGNTYSNLGFTAQYIEMNDSTHIRFMGMDKTGSLWTHTTLAPDTEGFTVSDTITELGQASVNNIQGTNVIANPTLAGTESDLEGIEIDGTKYKVGGGGKQLYQHNISIKNHLDNTASSTNIRVFITILNDRPTEYDLTSLINYLYNNNFIVNNLSNKDRNDFKQCSGGYTYSDGVQFTCGGIACDSNKTGFYFNVGTMGRVEFATSSSFVTTPNVTVKDTVITL